jgi:hydrogenase-4 component F
VKGEKEIKMIGGFNAALYALVLAGAAVLLVRRDIALFDMLSRFFIFVVAVVAFAAALYSVSYIAREVRTGVVSPGKARLYYLLFNVFCGSMLLVPMTDNLGMMWVAIEMTTLVSAFLVGFANNKTSVEAAWKYIIICSAGIILALFGTILFSYANANSGGARSLQWTDIMVRASSLDPSLVKIALVFILVGYGTKAGLAPMHTWLPDAHSQAVAPISALLSGVLLKTSIYAILRFGMIANKSVGPYFFCHLMLFFGMVSLVVAAGFVLVQKDLKRLLAYSSIEHVGIVAVGIGLGTPLGVAAALFHIFNHAVTKSLMFFSAGNIVSVTGAHRMNGMSGIIHTMPFTGFMALIGVFALTGFPPFSIFFSEFFIIMAAFEKGSFRIAGAVLFFIVVVFGAMIFHLSNVLFGPPAKGAARQGEPLGSKLAFLFLLTQIIGAGVLVLWLSKGNWTAWIPQGLF